jgi:hypothetical protein
MTTSSILHREVADDIERLETAEAPKSCTAFRFVRDACVRGLRLSEDARTVARQNRMLLLTLMAINLLQAKEQLGVVLVTLAKLWP